MKWIIVYAMVVNGHLQYSEVHDFEDWVACESQFLRLINMYQADGVDLKDISGDCYMVPKDFPPAPRVTRGGN